jgi:hypothetical protein
MERWIASSITVENELVVVALAILQYSNICH